ncbi:hypothetical protein [Endozoicomonas elysicola]|uniref:DUF2232 domain-containing protein n=1 Tax=Endozoicomonas elysicola TaxID=305900 RepID=A0A081K7A1_9GAMM|nr:hypothetical protein [Endozoicomonas elysicola]KEI70027.1 hypothetical protein GV64_04035 [Endozoicomonas elysicola]
MRGLAELAMRGPKQAMILAIVFACIPMLFWVSAAIISLVVLRRGAAAGLKLLVWAALPGIAWAAMGQFSTIIGLTTTVTLALVLRQTVSWQKTLLALLPAGALIALVLAQLAPQQITLISELVMTFIRDYVQQAGQSTDDLVAGLRPLVEYGVIGVVAWFNLVSCILGLVLARSWQSHLYNPGGFREEFHRIRLPLTVAMGLLAFTLVGATIAPFLLVVVPAATLPLLVAGLAMIHGLVGMRQLGSFWLVGFYILLIFVTQLAYPVIVLTACLDSLFDFRARAANRLHQG